MIDKQYLQQLEKCYPQYLGNLVLGRPFQPVRLLGGKKKPATVTELYSGIDAFLKYEKKEGRPGWVIQWEPWQSKTLGNQRWPASVWVEGEEDYLHLIGKKREAAQFKALVHELLAWKAELAPWLVARPLKVLELQLSWKELRAVVDFLLAREVRAHYLRSLPVPVHTKFLQQHGAIILSMLQHLQAERFPVGVRTLEEALGLKVKPLLFTVRWLDKGLAGRYTSEIEVLSVPVEDLRRVDWSVQEVWLVENETNLHLLPPRKGALAIFSKGYALHDLAGIPLLEKARLFYWGDLDEDGFLMLGQFRGYYPHAGSVFMDSGTVGHHAAEMTRVEFRGRQEPAGLTPGELQAYGQLKQMSGRIEQEQLQQDYVQACLQQIG